MLHRQASISLFADVIGNERTLVLGVFFSQEGLNQFEQQLPCLAVHLRRIHVAVKMALIDDNGKDSHEMPGQLVIA